MSILLQNLLARNPAHNDVTAVADILNACEIVENGQPCYSEERVLADWQRTGFSLESDAWIITTRHAQVAGYADVWMPEASRVELRVRVHPAYRRRGIGTLLLRLAEDQARRLVKRARAVEPVMLYSVISDANEAGKHLLELEGFALADRRWRVSIGLDESPAISGDASLPAVDLPMDAPAFTGITPSSPRTGIYTARCYIVYEKALRRSEILYAAEALTSAA